jgi:hypothetical protein
MSNAQRVVKDDLERQVIHNIAEYGWHAVNIVEDILRLARLFVPRRFGVVPRCGGRDFLRRGSQACCSSLYSPGVSDKP